MPITEHTTPLERRVPGIRAVRRYQRSWLRPDLIAGLVLAAILVPQGMAYAELAGLPPVTGLYTTIACLVGYAVFGRVTEGMDVVDKIKVVKTGVKMGHRDVPTDDVVIKSVKLVEDKK